MHPSFAVPIYEPSPYVFSGLTLDQLPLLARYYLADIAEVLPPALYEPELLAARRSQLALALFRSLQGVDMALVERRQDARRTAAQRPDETVEQWRQRTEEQDRERIETVVDVLLPERQILLDEFMIKLDTLVWVEMEGQTGSSRRSVQEQQVYRDEICAPILEYTNKALIALDEAVMAKTTEMEQHMSAGKQELSLRTHDRKGQEPHKPSPRVRLPRRHGTRSTKQGKSPEGSHS